MTRDEILALSDADLVRHVAEQVMGWHLWPKPCHDDRYLMDGASIRKRLPNGTDRLWEPLTDWNDCSSVWEAMQTKGFGSFAIEYEDGFRPYAWFSNRPKGDVSEEARSEDGRRAILQAALIAVGATS